MAKNDIEISYLSKKQKTPSSQFKFVLKYRKKYIAYLKY